MDTEKKDIKKPKTKTVVGEVNCDQLRIREEPSTESDVLRILSFKEPVVIVEEGSTEDFYKVINNGIVGFCAKEYITVVK